MGDDCIQVWRPGHGGRRFGIAASLYDRIRKFAVQSRRYEKQAVSVVGDHQKAAGSAHTVSDGSSDDGIAQHAQLLHHIPRLQPVWFELKIFRIARDVVMNSHRGEEPWV